MLGALFVLGSILTASSGLLFGPLVGVFADAGCHGKHRVVARPGRPSSRPGQRVSPAGRNADRTDALDRTMRPVGRRQRFVPGISDAFASYAFGTFEFRCGRWPVHLSVPRRGAFAYTALRGEDVTAAGVLRDRGGASPPSSVRSRRDTVPPVACTRPWRRRGRRRRGSGSRSRSTLSGRHAL